jgi:hypothetical protein
MLLPIVVGFAVALAATAGLAGTKQPSRKKPAAGAQVSGEVIDREGSAVANATVVIRPAIEGASLAAATRTFELTTDAKGRFHLDGVPPGTYWFIAFSANLAHGATTALPVLGNLVVAIRLDETPTRA